MPYPERRKNHPVNYKKRTQITYFEMLITEALLVVVTGKRSQDEKDVVKGEGAFQQRGSVQRLGGGGSRLVRLGSEGESAGRGRQSRSKQDVIRGSQ